LPKVKLGVDCADRAGIYARAAIDAAICSDGPFVAGFADGVNRAGIVTSAAVDAFVGNCMSQSIHLLCIRFTYYFREKLA
jgi:hypothetical protein